MGFTRVKHMPSDAEVLDKILGMLPGVTSRKMMGEYLLYRGGKLFGGIYDNRLLLKITKVSATMLADYPSDFPYEGGGDMILCSEPYDADLINRTIDAMLGELPSRK